MFYCRKLSVAVAVLIVSDWTPCARAQTTPPVADVPPAATPAVTAEDEAAYTQTITGRADKIVATLGIADAEHSARVRELLVNHYRGLRAIHDERDAKVAEATGTPGADPTVLKAWAGVAKAQANIKLLYLNRYFVARLATELTPEQVDKVKDGLTYGVVQVTYNRFLKLLPELTDEQKREILANLIEAREHAMDAGSAEEKHAIFGKYKGRINNYLSAAGYDLKLAEKDLAAREKAARAAQSDDKDD